jgi:transcriptional regulator with XRE-family HTH domain
MPPTYGIPLKGLQTLRLTRAWSQAELAERARMAESTVSYLEAGKRLATPASLKKLMAAFGLADPSPLYGSGRREVRGATRTLTREQAAAEGFINSISA